MAYRRDIDGLRAVAVLAVVLYHYGVEWLPGGFAGVDIFFVISGYLITGILRDQIAGGRLSLADFYARRIRRIVPALVVVLAATIAGGYVFLMPGDYAALGESAAYASIGAGNLYFFWHTGYFEREAELLPLLHTWSLGVEEQFYLVWPLLLAGIVRVASGRPRLVVASIAALTAVSFAWSLYALSADPKAAFYLPHLRAWELAAGAMLAFVPPIAAPMAGRICGVIGLAAITWSLATLDVARSFPGWSALAPVVGAVCIVWPKPPVFASRILGVGPLRHVGLVSYSLYLWHWPILVFFRHYASGEMPTGREALALGAIAYVLSVASWWFVERPFRRGSAARRVVLAAGVATIVIGAAAGSVLRVSEGVPSRFGDNLKGMESLAAMWEWPCPRVVDLAELGTSVCNFGRPWNDAAVKGILWGDSHAEHMAPMVEAAIEGRDASFVLVLPCPAILGGNVTREHKDLPSYASDCADRRRRAEAFLDRHPDVRLVVFSSSWSPLSTVVSLRGGKGTENGVDLVQRGLVEVMDRLAQPSRQFLLIAQVPGVNGDPVPCLLSNVAGVQRRACDTIGERFATWFNRRERPMYERFDHLAADRHDLTLVQPAYRLCRDGACVTAIDGEPLYRDGNHIRRNLSPGVRRAYAERIGLVEAIDTAIRHVGGE